MKNDSTMANLKGAKKGDATSVAIMDELIEYANNIGVGAVIGDSFMYLLATPLLYVLLKLKDEDNQFIRKN